MSQPPSPTKYRGVHYQSWGKFAAKIYHTDGGVCVARHIFHCGGGGRCLCATTHRFFEPWAKLNILVDVAAAADLAPPDVRIISWAEEKDHRKAKA